MATVAGNSDGIRIHAIFISKASGEVLKGYAGRPDIDLWIIPTFENSAWSIMAISFISLLAMSAVLATCFFVRRHRIRRERPRPPNAREFHGMSKQLVKAMPSIIFTSALEDNCTSRTCAICLEDYDVGEQIRILPCRHSKSTLIVNGPCITYARDYLILLLFWSLFRIRERFMLGVQNLNQNLIWMKKSNTIFINWFFCRCNLGILFSLSRVSS